MGPYNEFAILEEIDENREYSFVEIQDYDCIKISDDYVNKWVNDLLSMNTFWQNIKNPKHGLARYGVTLIPPESLPQFHECMKKKESIEITKLLRLTEKAIENRKFIIHFGI